MDIEIKGQVDRLMMFAYINELMLIMLIKLLTISGFIGDVHLVDHYKIFNASWCISQ